MFRYKRRDKLVIISQIIGRKEVYFVKRKLGLDLTIALEVFDLVPVWGFVFYLWSMIFQEWNFLLSSTL